MNTDSTISIEKPTVEPPRSCRAFVSYARSDGTEMAEKLRSRLKESNPEIVLWQDKTSMLAGIGWWNQITEALDNVDILIMVLSPSIGRSEIALMEWRYARQQGVRVCPVLVDQHAIDYDTLPRWMRKVHCYELDRDWDLFIGFLHSHTEASRVPFMAPEKSSKYVERKKLLDMTVSELLSDSAQAKNAARVVLKGAGGYGKSTLACQVCHDDRVVTAFDDGILWVQLGPTPEILSQLTKLYAVMTGERPNFIDIDDATIHLRQRLEKKACLVVIDDAWNANHVKQVLNVGGDSAWLVTTRFANIAEELDATQLDIQEMSDSESLQMLTRQISTDLVDLTSAKVIGKLMGQWPLLLSLATKQINARIRKGDSLKGAVHYLKRAMEKKGVLAFDSVPLTRNDAIDSSVILSFEDFSSEEKQKCLELCVFKEGESIPVQIICEFWNMDHFETEELLLKLDNAALLSFNLKNGVVSLHSMLHSYYIRKHGDVLALHKRISELWKDGVDHPSKIFVLSCIGWHYIKAEMQDQFLELIFNFKWLETRLTLIPVHIVLFELQQLKKDDCINSLSSALRLSSAGLSQSSGQLANQLIWRLPWDQSERINMLLKEAKLSLASKMICIEHASLSRTGGALSGILKSHNGAVYALALSPFGDRMVSGSEDWTLRLWNLERMTIEQVYSGHSGMVTATLFTPDGSKIVSASEDRTIRIWDVETGRIEHVLRGHSLAIKNICFIANATKLASVSEDGTICIWDFVSKIKLSEFSARGHQAKALDAEFVGNSVAYGAGDGSIRLFNIDVAKEISVLKNTGIVSSLIVSTTGESLYAGTSNGEILQLTLPDLEIQTKLCGHTDAVECMVSTNDGKLLISGARDRRITVWDLDSGIAIASLNGHSGFVTTLDVSPADNYLFSGSTDNTIRQWDLSCINNMSNPKKQLDSIKKLAISTDGFQILSSSSENQAVLWCGDPSIAENDDANENESLYPITLCVSERWLYRASIAVSNSLAAISSRNSIGIWNLKCRTFARTLIGHSQSIKELFLSENGGRLLSFSKDNTVRLWDVQSGLCLRSLVSSDNKRMLTMLTISDAMILESVQGLAVDTCETIIRNHSIVAFNPNGEFSVVASSDNVCWWCANTGETVEWQLTNFEPFQIAFYGNSRCFAISSVSGELTVFEPGKPALVASGHQGRIFDLTFPGFGDSLLSAGADGTVRRWDMDLSFNEVLLQYESESIDAALLSPLGEHFYTVRGDTLSVVNLNDNSRSDCITFDHQLTSIAVTESGARSTIGDTAGAVHVLSVQA